MVRRCPDLDPVTCVRRTRADQRSRMLRRQRREIDLRRRDRMTRFKPGHASQTGALALRIEQPDRGERQVALIARQAPVRSPPAPPARNEPRRARGKFTQRGKPPFADDPIGVLGNDAQHAADCAVIVRQRAVGEGVIGFFRKPLRSRNSSSPSSHVASPVRITVSARGPMSCQISRPHFRRRTAKRPRMLGAKRHPGVGVVVEERQVRPPAEPHRVARGDHDAQHGPETLRPADQPARPRVAVQSLASINAAISPPALRNAEPTPISLSGSEKFTLPLLPRTMTDANQIATPWQGRAFTIP